MAEEETAFEEKNSLYFPSTQELPSANSEAHTGQNQTDYDLVITHKEETVSVNDITLNIGFKHGVSSLIEMILKVHKSLGQHFDPLVTDVI